MYVIRRKQSIKTHFEKNENNINLSHINTNSKKNERNAFISFIAYSA